MRKALVYVNIYRCICTYKGNAMRTGRPVCKDTQYKIIVHTNGGHRYASTDEIYDKLSGKQISIHEILEGNGNYVVDPGHRKFII